MNRSRKSCIGSVALLALATLASAARADIITDWNARAAEFASKAAGPPAAVRAMAMTQMAVFEAVNSITRAYPSSPAAIEPAPGASVDAAVAAASRGVLLKAVPPQQAAIDTAYQAALAAIPDSPAKAKGIEAGEKAAAAILALRASDADAQPDTYRPHAAPGAYVPTMIPAAFANGLRKPWVMTSPQQFRPGPPPALTSELWAKDFNEIKALGGKTGSKRTDEQTTIARFWEATLPVIYWPIARSVASAPGRDVTRNARLFAACGVAMDDALIAVFDAKYAYNFWRPVTAIRNGDQHNNAAVARDAGWTPFIDTPMHPEYPCAHCIVAASLGAVLEADIGTGATPALSSTSPTAPGVTRSWSKVSDFVTEVQMARIYDGVHYRNSTQVGAAMGKQIGELAARTLLK